jgi:acetyl esterase/lipase
MSAGVGLTVALTLLARDRGEVAVAFQLPLYPMIDDRACTLSSIDNDAPLWNSSSNALACSVYLNVSFGAGSGPLPCPTTSQFACTPMSTPIGVHNQSPSPRTSNSSRWNET